MVGIALTLAASVGLLAGIVHLARRRHSRHRFPSGLDPMPAGIKHLASSVGDLSDLGLRLPTTPRGLMQRHRLAVLLGLR